MTSFEKVCLLLAGMELLREREAAAGGADLEKIDELIDELNDDSRRAPDDDGDDDEDEEEDDDDPPPVPSGERGFILGKPIEDVHLDDDDEEACDHDHILHNPGDPAGSWRCANCGHVFGVDEFWPDERWTLTSPPTPNPKEPS